MKNRSLTFACLLLLVAPGVASLQDVSSPKAKEATTEEPKPVAAFEGSLAQAQDRLVQVHKDQDITQAEQFAQSLLQPRAVDRVQAWLERNTGFLGARASSWVRELLPWLGFELRSAEQQATVHYDLGCLQSAEGLGEEATQSFETATYLAPGPVRLDATYNLGCLDLQQAEVYFDQIPEVHGRTRSATSPGFMPGKKGLADDEEEPDYLKLARAAYGDALDDFTERLKLDWRSPDTRANVEWILQRMDKLDEIEEERKSDEGQGQAQDDPSAGEGEEEENKDDAGEKGAESEEEEPKDQEQSQEQSEKDESKEQGQTQDREQDEQSEDDQSSQKEGESEEVPESKPEERHLTEEEIKRLLEQSMKHDKDGVEMRKRVESRQRKRVKEDW
ncbi:MAG: hypothetical protein GY930_04495 [bacterium]|nr:hypothetical protein [bacterium]